MTQFATSEEFAARLGITLTEEETTRADALLALASGLIQDAAKQTIELVEDDVLTLPGTNDDRITLPERPVVSVASLTIAGSPLVGGEGWYLDGSTIIRIPSSSIGIAWLVDDAEPSPGFGSPRQPVVVTYTHGYEDEDMPAIVKTICLEAAVRVWVNPGVADRETVGDTFTAYANATGLLLTDDEHDRLRRFFGMGFASVTMGG